MSKQNTTSKQLRPEHPRPQFVRESWLSLNGIWSFALDPGQSGEERDMPKGQGFDSEITVPFCPESKLSGIELTDFIPSCWYAVYINIPEEWVGNRTLLHFGAVDYESTLWLNGNKVGTHRGGYSSFTMDITDFLKDGENLLVLRANDNTRDPLIPSGKQSDKYDSYGCFYTRTTGIWQTVWLESVPQTYLKTVKYYTDITNNKVNIQAQIAGDTSDCDLTCIIKDNGKEITRTTIKAAANVSMDISIPDAVLWEPGKPYLYDVEFILSCEGTDFDRVSSYLGMREVKIEGYKVLINGKSVFQRLVLDQGFYPDGIYTAPTDRDLKKDIEMSLTAGFNGARLHEKVFEERFLYWCDKLGYLVWGEFPNWGLSLNIPGALDRMTREWVEVMERDFNHPAIIGWCPFNETTNDQDPEILRTVCRLTKTLDTTRPVIDTSGYFHVETDIYDVHDYEQNPEVLKSHHDPMLTDDSKAWKNFPEPWNRNASYQGKIPYFVSEYGGIWWNPNQKDEKSWGYGNRPSSEEDFVTRYIELTKVLLNHPKMFGFCYTQLYDVEQEVNGLYTYDRKMKISAKSLARIKEINQTKAAIED